MRLDKFLATVTGDSRKTVKLWMKQKRVQVNQTTVKDPKFQVAEQTDVVTLDGLPQHYQQFYYYMMNKPADVLSATKDSREMTVLDLLADKDYREDLFPIGRLDKDTTGLLILSNDGQLSHRLLSPKKHVAKLYEATVDGVITDKDSATFKKGVVLKDFTAQPAILKLLSTQAQQSHVSIQITEGKFHQIKRMFGAIEKPVLSLKRVKMGQLALDPALEPGQYRALSDQELDALQARAD